MDLICIHEAGHAVTYKQEFGRVPVEIVVDLALASATHSAPLGWPAHGHQATQFAAYYYAGQEAIKHAVKLGLLPTDTDPDDGFVGPDDSDCDAAKLKLLAKWGVSEIDARNLARMAIKNYWGQLIAIAAHLQNNNGKIDQPALTVLLETVPLRT